MPCAAAYARNDATSAGSIALAFPPRGLRVKNWNVFAPSDTASSAMAR